MSTNPLARAAHACAVLALAGALFFDVLDPAIARLTAVLSSIARVLL